MIKFLIIIIFLFCGNREVQATAQKQRLRIDANKIIFKKNKNEVIFIEKVKAKQDELELYANKMIVFYDKETDGVKILRIEAFENVVVKKPDMNAVGDEAVYNVADGIITVNGNVVLTEENSVAYGDTLVYDVVKGEGELKGQKKSADKKERITIILEDIDKTREKYESK